jgi:hypothetical protein
MKEAPGSSETSVLTRATRRNNPEDTILLIRYVKADGSKKTKWCMSKRKKREYKKGVDGERKEKGTRKYTVNVRAEGERGIAQEPRGVEEYRRNQVVR